MRTSAVMPLFCVLLTACSSQGDIQRVGELEQKVKVRPSELKADRSKAMAFYRGFLDSSSVSHPRYNDALTRLADLEMGAGDSGQLAQSDIEYFQARRQLIEADRKAEDNTNYQNAIQLYQDLLEKEKRPERQIAVLYNLARAQEQVGELEQAIASLQALNQRYPHNRFSVEAAFRTGELQYSLQQFESAATAYQQVLNMRAGNDYLRRSRYKLGWAYLKLERLQPALQSFMDLMVSLKPVTLPGGELDQSRMSRIDRELLDDVFRSINITLSYSQDLALLHQVASTPRYQALEFLLLRRFAAFLIRKERSQDARDLYTAYVRRHGDSFHSAMLQIELVAMHEKTGVYSRIVRAREDFLNRFGPGSAQWSGYTQAQQAQLEGAAFNYVSELAAYWHARWQKRKRKQARKRAMHWYAYAAQHFLHRADADQLVFMLAELSFESRDYNAAARLYQQVAYDLHGGEHAAESAYAAILSVDQAPQGKAKQRRLIELSQLFVKRFTSHKHFMAVERRLLELLYQTEQYREAEVLAEKMVQAYGNRKEKQARVSLMAALLIGGHIAYSEKNYALAQQRYTAARPGLKKGSRIEQKVTRRLAASTYQLGRAALEAGDSKRASQQLLAAASMDSSTGVGAVAQYDAAVALIAVKEWKSAAQQLEAFVRRWPGHELVLEARRKLVILYQHTKEDNKALKGWQWLAANEKDSSRQLPAWWQVVDYATRLQQTSPRVQAYKAIIRHAKTPYVQSMEARQSLSELYLQTDQVSKARYWQRDMVKAEAGNPQGSTPRTVTLAAGAQLALARDEREKFETIKLTLPLKKSLRRKKQALKRALAAFDKVEAYAVQEAVTATTFEIASMYQNFGEAIMRSQRPRKIGGEELEMYNLMLEEQAFPFEEKAIALYESNAMRVRQGVFDQWVERSYARLSSLQPAAYRRQEEVRGFF